MQIPSKKENRSKDDYRHLYAIFLRFNVCVQTFSFLLNKPTALAIAFGWLIYYKAAYITVNLMLMHTKWLHSKNV